jgi:hypothetical protein
MKPLEKIFNVKIYPCYKNPACISPKEFESLNQEMRELAKQTFGTIPEYQCFLNDYSTLKDKLLIIHRNNEGVLDGISSSVVVRTQDKKVKEFLHLGILIVSPSERHKHIQFKLGICSAAAYCWNNPLKKRYWITNLSSVLGTLSIVDKMFLGVYPGLKQSLPSEDHLIIAQHFQNGVAERCYINPGSLFDHEQFLYKKANDNNCFLKKSTDKQYHSLNSKHNDFYSQIADFDNGDAILQVGYFNHFRFSLVMLAYVYRILVRDTLMHTKTGRSHV